MRNYSDKEISDAELKDILEQAMHAPTTGNMQLYSVVVTRDPKMKERLAPAHFNQPSVEKAAVLLTVCADTRRFGRWCEVSGANPGFDNFQGFLYALCDAMILAQQIVTVAEMKGLGTCYLGTVMFNAPQIAEILELPERVVPVACITMGWPEGESPVSERIPVEGFMHEEVYRPESDSRIIDIYRVKDDFPANARFVEDNEKESLAQVFTDVRYPRAMNEEFSKIYHDFIRKQGFRF